MKIGIIGGGISGLYAAYKLKQKGINYTIFEKSSTFGGRFKYGLKIFNPTFESKFYELLKELNLESSLRYFSRNKTVVYDNNIEHFYELSDLISDLSDEDVERYEKIKEEALKEEFNVFNPSKRLQELRKISLEKYLEEVDSEFVRKIVYTVLSCSIVNSVDLSEISAEYFLFKLRLMLEYEKENSQTFSKDEGSEVVIKALEERIQQDNIHLSSEVVDVSKKDKEITISYQNENKKEEEKVDVVIFAIPLDKVEKINSQVDVGKGVEYNYNDCYLVEGNKSIEQDLILGFGDNNANLESCHHISYTQYHFFPCNQEKDIDLNVFFNNYLVLNEEKDIPVNTVLKTNLETPAIQQENFYLCGDFHYYPSPETAIKSADKAIELIEDL